MVQRRRWRELRHLTQLDVALDAGISSRHLSYIETGKALPSREMLATLAQALDIPLRERNLVYLAAGDAALYEETPLADERMAEARAATLTPYVVVPGPRLNVLHLIFEDRPLRQVIVNWQEVAKALLEQLQRAAAWTHEPHLHALISALLGDAGVPEAWRVPRLDAPRRLLLPCELTGLGAAHNARMFSTVTTLSGPQDITLQDLHIEAFYPADAETAALRFYQD